LGSTFSQFNVGAPLGLVTGLVGSIVSIVLVVVISVYLLIEGRAVIATLRRLFPAHTRMFDFMVLAVGSTADAYVRGQVLMSLLIGVYTTLSMAALGVHFAVVLGVAAAILELVPLVLGAAYRWHQGATPLTTSARGKIKVDSLPRLGDEIGVVDRDGIGSDPVPREKGT
jgi:predicted PurR-regulated permease PerM